MMCDVVQTERAWGKGRLATKVRENGFESEACPPDRTTGRVESLEGSVGLVSVATELVHAPLQQDVGRAATFSPPRGFIGSPTESILTDLGCITETSANLPFGSGAGQ